MIERFVGSYNVIKDGKDLTDIFSEIDRMANFVVRINISESDSKSTINTMRSMLDMARKRDFLPTFDETIKKINHELINGKLDSLIKKAVPMNNSVI